MNRRTFFSWLGSAIAAGAVVKANTNPNGLRQAQRVARDWATRHTIYRPSTGQAFVSPSHGRTNDYVEVGNIHSDKPYGTNLNRQEQVD